MAEEFLLVSCDIVGYSAEPDIALQLQRAQAVNDMIRPAVEAAGSDQGFCFQAATAVMWPSPVRRRLGRHFSSCWT